MVSDIARASRLRELGGKSHSKRMFSSPPRFSRPRAPISRTLWPRLKSYLPRDEEQRRRMEDYLLYAGVVTVFAIATYLLVFD